MCSTTFAPAVERHNYWREQHGAAALKWDNTLAQRAQDWADNCYFEHSSYVYGESGLELGGGWEEGSLHSSHLQCCGQMRSVIYPCEKYTLRTQLTRCSMVHPAGENLGLGPPQSIIDLWYGEVCQYNYTKPAFSESTGHFTQVSAQVDHTSGSVGLCVCLSRAQHMALSAAERLRFAWRVLVLQDVACVWGGSRWRCTCARSHDVCGMGIQPTLHHLPCPSDLTANRLPLRPQVVWTTTQYIGCAIGYCPSGVVDAMGTVWKRSQNFVCEYWPPGNQYGEWPAVRVCVRV